MAFITAEVVAGQTFTLTTGVVKPAGGGSDDSFVATGLDARSGSFSIDSFSFLNTLAAASLASGHRSAPRFC